MLCDILYGSIVDTVIYGSLEHFLEGYVRYEGGQHFPGRVGIDFLKERVCVALNPKIPKDHRRPSDDG
jgi:hypothetical protein